MKEALRLDYDSHEKEVKNLEKEMGILERGANDTKATEAYREACKQFVVDEKPKIEQAREKFDGLLKLETDFCSYYPYSADEKQVKVSLARLKGLFEEFGKLSGNMEEIQKKVMEEEEKRKKQERAERAKQAKLDAKKKQENTLVAATIDGATGDTAKSKEAPADGDAKSPADKKDDENNNDIEMPKLKAGGRGTTMSVDGFVKDVSPGKDAGDVEMRKEAKAGDVKKTSRVSSPNKEDSGILNKNDVAEVGKTPNETSEAAKAAGRGKSPSGKYSNIIQLKLQSQPHWLLPQLFQLYTSAFTRRDCRLWAQS